MQFQTKLETPISIRHFLPVGVATLLKASILMKIAFLFVRFHQYESCVQAAKFMKLADYIKWTKETADDYHIRIDNRTTIEITHMGISGITGSGKSYFCKL